MSFWHRLILTLCLLLPLAAGASPLALAQGLVPVPTAEQTGPAPAASVDPKLTALLTLLSDPQVQDRLLALAQPLSTPTPAASGTSALQGVRSLQTQIDRTLTGFDRLLSTLPYLPQDLGYLSTVLAYQLEEQGLLKLALGLFVFVGLGYGIEHLYWRIGGLGMAAIARRPIRSLSDRFWTAVLRVIVGMTGVLCFALGSVGAFVALTLSGLFGSDTTGQATVLELMLLAYLVAFLLARTARLLGRWILSPPIAIFPEAYRHRLVPVDDDTSWFLQWRVRISSYWIFVGFTTVEVLSELGLQPRSVLVLSEIVYFGILGLLLELILRWPASGRRWGWGYCWFVASIVTVIWLLAAADSIALARLIGIIFLLPLVLSAARALGDHLLRRPEDLPPEEVWRGMPRWVADFIGRCIRAGLVVTAFWMLIQTLDLDLMVLDSGSGAARMVQGAFDALTILLGADLIWSLSAGLIASQLDCIAREEASEGSQARMQTLLPILRNVLAVVIVTLTSLMVLAALGVEVGPLLAGAGVVGIAVGFGAQTLVRDIFSGIFFLFDDAFRVGEYIMAGDFKGTVESFSLRSVKLRHHRGPLTTVPFGELGAVQNLSRDWVIDKFTIGVAYDTDLDRVKKLIKKIGQDLAQDPEFKPIVLEPLKLQGVDRFGEYSIDLKLKIKTKPGQQFVIRRRAYAQIKKVFEAEGISFAQPIIQVNAGEDPTAAAGAARARRRGGGEGPDLSQAMG